MARAIRAEATVVRLRKSDSIWSFRLRPKTAIGTVAGTIVQNPYEYGYQSVKILKDILEKKEVKDFIDIPPRKVTKENVDEYWADLKAKKAG